jgi:hypothetical protein
MHQNVHLSSFTLCGIIIHSFCYVIIVLLLSEELVTF